MSNEIQHELGILTNDGWVITLMTDKEVTFGDAVINSIIVQPREDFIKRVEREPDVLRRLYPINYMGEAFYERLRDSHTPA
jgi:hypothetical protein